MKTRTIFNKVIIGITLLSSVLLLSGCLVKTKWNVTSSQKQGNQHIPFSNIYKNTNSIDENPELDLSKYHIYAKSNSQKQFLNLLNSYSNREFKIIDKDVNFDPNDKVWQANVRKTFTDKGVNPNVTENYIKQFVDRGKTVYKIKVLEKLPKGAENSTVVEEQNKITINLGYSFKTAQERDNAEKKFVEDINQLFINDRGWHRIGETITKPSYRMSDLRREMGKALNMSANNNKDSDGVTNFSYGWKKGDYYSALAIGIQKRFYPDENTRHWYTLTIAFANLK